jgi:lipopolysaccharide transport protein LptA
MKKSWPILLVLLAALALRAQTNAPDAASAAPVQKEPRAPTEISSDSGQFNLKSNIFVYTGNVHVNDPKLKLLCEIMTVEAPKLVEGKFNRMTAVSNVVIDFLDEKGQPNHATADRAVYTESITNSFTNKVVVLTGSPVVTNLQGALRGDLIEWNLLTDEMKVLNEKTTIHQSGTNGANFFETLTTPGTNSPKSKMDSAPK